MTKIEAVNCDVCLMPRLLTDEIHELPGGKHICMGCASIINRALIMGYLTPELFKHTRICVRKLSCRDEYKDNAI